MSKQQGVTYMVAVAMLAVGAFGVACGRTPERIDLTTVAPCPAEDGPGTDGPVPCVWDGAERGNRVYGNGARWVLYSPDTCPKNTTQDRRMVTCVSRADWTGGVESERTN